MMQMKKAMVRLDDNNARQLQAIARALNRNPTLKTSLPTLVNFMLDTYGIPAFLKSDVYKDATK
jgi:hypothetical protein